MSSIQRRGSRWFARYRVPPGAGIHVLAGD
jgi:hypothetical protein